MRKIVCLTLALIAPVLSGCATRVSPEASWTPRLPEADSIRVTQLEPGVRHSYLWLDEGPWAVHVLEVDAAVCAPELEAVKPGPPLSRRATTSVLAAGALAGINADFFMLPQGTPVGAHVTGGRVLAGPGDRPVHALTAGGGLRAGRAALAGFVAADGDTVALVQVNRDPGAARYRPARPGVRLFDAWFGDDAPVDSAGPTLRVRRLHAGPGASARSAAVSLEPASGVVVSVHPPRDSIPIDPEHVALQAHARAGSDWLGRRAPGDTVSWQGAVTPFESPAGRPTESAGANPAEHPGGNSAEASGPASAAMEAVGGFPLLVDGGRGVYAEQPGVSRAFGGARHPRTAVGWGADGGLFWVVVDGRQAPYSDGMSLPELEWLFLRLGAVAAINLDGGGSTAMVVEGRLVNRPSDADGERPVGNALALRGCGGRG